MSLVDKQGRKINYLRLAVTDRCNLRCFYCMPESGINYVAQNELMSYEELASLARVLSFAGIRKVRITGGEPFLRKDMMQFLHMLADLEKIDEIHITTNGTLTSGFIPELKKIGIQSINLSLDSLDHDRFFRITRRPVFNQVMETMDKILTLEIPLKINTVVMDGQNTEDIGPLAELTRKLPITVRFIEEMPFNGSGKRNQVLEWNHIKIRSHLEQLYPGLYSIPAPVGSTSQRFKIPGFRGGIGIIAAYSRTFCQTCNRIRVTPTGMLKTCLYDHGVFNIKDLMRNGASEPQIIAAVEHALAHRAKDGFEAEKQRTGSPISESMSTIGG